MLSCSECCSGSGVKGIGGVSSEDISERFSDDFFWVRSLFIDSSFCKFSDWVFVMEVNSRFLDFSFLFVFSKDFISSSFFSCLILFSSFLFSSFLFSSFLSCLILFSSFDLLFMFSFSVLLLF